MSSVGIVQVVSRYGRRVFAENLNKPTRVDERLNLIYVDIRQAMSVEHSINEKVDRVHDQLPLTSNSDFFPPPTQAPSYDRSRRRQAEVHDSVLDQLRWPRWCRISG